MSEVKCDSNSLKRPVGDRTVPFRLFFVFFLLCFSFELHAKEIHQGNILVITSYNPDTRRMTGFINELEQTIVQKNYDYGILVENMACKGIEDIGNWENNLRTILSKCEGMSLKGIVLLGQEAWNTYVNYTDSLPNVPTFAFFASANGILKPRAGVNIEAWTPQYLDAATVAQERGNIGGFLNTYHVEENVKLIKSLYGEVARIAVVTDNSYGGAAMQAFVKREMQEKFPKITVEWLDGRKESATTIIRKIGRLPQGTVVLLGTWRIDKDGSYFMQSSLNNLMKENPNIPVFSLSGLGIGTIAIGGYVPNYAVDVPSIAQEINRIDEGRQQRAEFHYVEGGYRFDALKLKEFGIAEYQLPEDSTIENHLESELQRYRDYIFYAVIGLLFLSICMMVLMKLYWHNKQLKDALLENEEELIKAKNKAEEADKIKSTFLTNMSHEVRTPLNAIVGFSALMVDDSLKLEERREFASQIQRNSELLLTLVNDVLDISRLETGKMTFLFREVNLSAICQQALYALHHQKKEGVEYRFECNRENYLLNTDGQRLSQVLINLLTNANKFTEKGSILLRYEVQEERSRVVFTVTDTGCGIPLEKQASVFNRFEKLNEYQQGTGLGLAICKQIARHFKGEIYVDPIYTEGTRFVFIHPIG